MESIQQPAYMDSPCRLKNITPFRTVRYILTYLLTHSMEQSKLVLS